MRELVYLSEGKLRQFTSRRLRRKLRDGDVEGEIKTPIGGLRIGHKPSGGRLDAFDFLERVIAELERSDRAPKWFEDDSVEPGQWVHFEARLRYWIMPEAHFSSAVIFKDSYSPWDGDLFLHGSASNLLGNIPSPTEIDLDGRQIEVGTSPEPPSTSLYAYKAHAHAEKARIRQGAKQLADGSATEDQHTDRHISRADPVASTILQALRELQGDETAAWMAGIARVTGVFDVSSRERWSYSTSGRRKVLAASPLYVEYITPPGNDGW